MDKDSLTYLAKKAKIEEKRIKIIELCKSRSVLDVGCVGQDYSYKNPNWLHNEIKSIANSIDGVDIVYEGIEELKKMGYSIFHADELQQLGKQYEIILMSDVIEHVDNPVEFIRFYAKFLKENGKMIITTPNAHGIRNFTSIIVRNSYSLNPEHTFWFCPRTLSEVVNRANLTIVDFVWLKEYYTISQIKRIWDKILFRFNGLMMRIRRNFCPNFMLIISNK